MATEITKSTQLAWRKFLQSEAGVEGMLFLREKTPSVSKGESHAIAFDAGRVDGYKLACDTISEIIAIRQQKEEVADND